MRLASLLLAVVLQAQEKPGSLEGTIVANGEPKSGIGVTIGKQEAKTDAAGKYSLRDVPAGRHTVNIGGPFRSPVVRVSRTITIQPGQAVNADFGLTVTSSVSGTVLDEFDEPASGMEVVLLGREYGAGSPRYFRSNVAVTNDQGGYRFDYVRPEVPYLILVFPIPPFRGAAKSDAPTDPRLRRPATVATFYPAVSDSAGAMPIVLRPGEHREAINIRMLRAPSYCIEAQLGGSDVSFQIHGAHIPYGMGPNGGTTGMPRTVKPGADGKVRICELPPADYRLTVFEGDVNEPISLASTTVHLFDRDAVNVVFQPTPRFKVPFELAWAGEPPAKPVEAKLRFAVSSMTRSFGSFGGIRDSATPPASTEISAILMDDYNLKIFGITGRLYLKEVRYGNDNITYAPFRPGTKHDGAVLRVAVGHDGAHIKARLRDRNGKPVPGAAVVVMPAVFASESELASALQTGVADQYGDYESTRALQPGKYYVLALTEPLPEPLPADRVVRLMNLRTHAREVTLEPGGTAELDLEPGSR